MIDVDHFKLFNDFGGHAEGDHCLKQIAEALRHAMRSEDDLVIRYGGEEFAVILQDADLTEARQAAERLREAVRDLKIPHPGLGQAARFPSASAPARSHRKRASAMPSPAPTNGSMRQNGPTGIASQPERRPVRSTCDHHSSGQASTIFQSSPPFLIFFISVVSPPLRRIQSFTVSG
ncbi:hypothetical protein ACVWVY_004966 [Bradyrhizobium sp. URHC0002]